MLPPEERLVGAGLSRYIDEQLYWVLHAPRQTGKTTFLISWMRELNASDKYVACYVSVERCQGIQDIERAIPAIYDAVRQSARMESLPVPEIISGNPVSLLSETLEEWAKLVAPKPLIVLFDEVDVLTGGAMISFLRQLRGGFASRETGKFPVSVALVGMRDLKDYLVQS
jgi:Cdc6-like AAA superfamily ATPase